MYLTSEVSIPSQHTCTCTCSITGIHVYATVESLSTVRLSLYRTIICPQLATLRGTILEEAIPSGTKIGTSRGLPPRDVLEYVTQGELQLSCLKLAKQQEKVRHWTAITQSYMYIAYMYTYFQSLHWFILSMVLRMCRVLVHFILGL